MGAMVREALLQGSTLTMAPCYTRITTSRRACRLPVRPIIPKVSCKQFPFVASSAIDRHLVRTHEPLLKQNALVKKGLVDSCQRSLFSEHWIEDCVGEIVKHIHEAPFLQMLFKREDSSTITLTQRERVPVGDALSVEEKWKEMKSHVNKASPDAVILVHDLCSSYVEGCDVEGGLAKRSIDREERSNGTQLWGVLVLGKTIARSACYILQTTSVASSFGTCTHFCLTKAQRFGPSSIEQIQSSWLLKTEV